MAMEITNNYSNYVAQSMMENSAAGSTKKKGTENASKPAEGSKSKSTAEYVNELAKLAPSVEFKVGNSFSTAKTGKTLTINPQLLEKMQNDPEQEKEMKELIKGVESAVNMLESVNKASGWTVVYKHCYIDENGKFCSIAYLRNDFMLNMSDELREERRKNSEKLSEKTKEKTAERKEKLEETLEEKKEAKREEKAEENTEEKPTYNKAEQLINKKIADSKDGMIYLNDTEIRTIIDALLEDNADKTTIKEQPQIGVNLDLKI